MSSQLYIYFDDSITNGKEVIGYCGTKYELNINEPIEPP